MPEGNLAECPYKGLVPYSEADTDFFFGRERDREVIVANLIASRLTLLYGASGVGKSSVLRAGVVPDLRELARGGGADIGSGAEYVPVILDAWSGDPRAEMHDRTAEAVAAMDIAVPDPPSVLPFPAAVRAWARAADASLIIILDQFEEFLLYHARGDGGDRAVSEIAAALSDEDSPASFLISVREDAVASLDQFKGRIPRLFDNYLRLRRLDPRAALEAIELPIEAFNRGKPPSEHFAVEPALAGSVIKQVAAGRNTIADAPLGGEVTHDRSGIETPFLQLVMTTLWNAEVELGSRLLRLQTLEQLRGAAHIVSSHLDRRIAGLSGSEQEICAKVFHQLVTPSGTKVAHRLTDLAAYSGVPREELEPVLAKLADPGWRILRVVSDDGPQREVRYEIFHDVLAVAVLDWRAQYQAHSAAAAIVAEERQRVRQRRSRLLRGLLVGVLAGLAVASLVVAVTARRRAAENDRRESVTASQALALASGRELGLDPMRALTLASSAAHTHPTAEAVSALRAALAGTRYRPIQIGSAPLEDADISSSGALAFVLTEAGTRELWRLGDDPELAVRFQRRGATTLAGRFSPDGTAVATLETGATVQVLPAVSNRDARSFPCRDSRPQEFDRGAGDASTGRLLAPVWLGSAHIATACLDRVVVAPLDLRQRPALLTGPSTVTAIAGSADGRRLAVGGADGSLRIWDGSQRRVARLGGAVAAIVLDRDGDVAVVATGRGELHAQHLGKPAVRLAGVDGADVAVIDVSPDGRWAVAGGRDGSVRLWRTATGALMMTLTGHTGAITTIAFSRAGNTVLTASSDRTARLWDVETGAALGRFGGHSAAIRRAVFGQGALSDSVVTVTADGGVRAWPVKSERAGTLAKAARSASFASGDDDVLVLGRGGDAELRRWGSDRRVPVDAPAGRWRDAVVSSDGRTAVLVPAPGARHPVAVVRLRTSTSEPLEAPSVNAAGFTPDGNALVTAGGDGTVRVWTADLLLRTALFQAQGALSDVLVTDDGERVVAIGTAGTTIWDMESGDIDASRDEPGTQVAANGTASRVVRVGGGAASVWEPARDRLRELFVAGDTVRAAAITVDGSVVATGGVSGTIWLWDGSTGERLDSLRFGGAPIRTLDFSFDDTSVVATTATGVVHVHECDICRPAGDLVALARRRLGR